MCDLLLLFSIRLSTKNPFYEKRMRKKKEKQMRIDEEEVAGEVETSII